MRRVLALAAHLAAFAPLSAAAEVQPAVAAEIRRGFVAVQSSASEQPALRLERAIRAPSEGFLLGTALGAWANSAGNLKFDLENPSGDGDDAEAIEMDCYDEGVAFAALDERSKAGRLSSQDLVGAAASPDPKLISLLQARQAGAPPRCR